MKDILDGERISVMAIQDNHLIGFVGAIPQYGVTGWELHPLILNETFCNKGIGSHMVVIGRDVFPYVNELFEI